MAQKSPCPADAGASSHPENTDLSRFARLKVEFKKRGMLLTFSGDLPIQPDDEPGKHFYAATQHGMMSIFSDLDEAELYFQLMVKIRGEEATYQGYSSEKSQYLILVAPEHPRSYLAPESEEDDGEPQDGPARTADVENALVIVGFSAAMDAFEALLKRYPAHQFRLEGIPSLKDGAL